METEIVNIYNEIGGYDVCLCEVGSTRVLQILDSSHDGLTRKREYYADENPRVECPEVFFES